MDLGTQALGVTSRPVGEHMVVQIAGELDAYSVATLRGELVKLSAEHRHTLVLDMGGLTFIDSSGLGVLVGAFKRARANHGLVCLLSPTERTLKMLNITGLVKVFPVFTDLQAALDHVENMER